MTAIQPGYSYNGFNFGGADVRSAAPLNKDTMPTSVSEMFQNYYDSQQRFLEARYSTPADTSNHPAYQDYATVRVNGKVVARIDNNGFVESPNALNPMLQAQLPGAVNGKSGPMLAQARAEKIAAFFGGEVERSSTAMTQTAFDGLPKAGYSVDTAAMRADPLYEQLQRSKQAHTEFVTQQIAQGDEVAGTQSKATGGEMSAAEAFLDYMSKTPEQRFFDAFLREKGLTQEEFDKLPPEERTDLMTEFEQKLEDKALESVAESLETT